MAKIGKIEGHRLLPLADGWEMTTTRAGEAVDPESLLAANRDWMPAAVPGTVAAAWRTAGGWDIDTRHDFDAQDAWYRVRFTLPPSSLPRFLRFEGLATLAEVWVNGTSILHSRNMFVSHDCDVTALLRQENELYIRFESLNAAIKTKRPRPRWRTRLVEHQNLRWFRTTLLGRMPGWAPYATPVGPWRPIFIEECAHLRVHQAEIKTSVEGGEGVVTADIHLQTLQKQQIRNASLVIEGISFPLTCRSEEGGTDGRGPASTAGGTATAGGMIFSGEARMPDVALWWPHTHGTPSRYRITICVEVSGTPVTLDLGWIGFRTVQWDSGFKINDRPVFCRGACWTPLDAVSFGGDTASYRLALQLARDAGINMLRLSGTMVYETDLFYDLCDEMGILVWQDLMFANMDYPDADIPFMAEVEEEVRQILNRLQLHPCLVLLCGNSEVEQQVAMLGLQRSQWRSPLFYEKIPALCRKYLHDLPYLPATPTGGALPFQVNTGAAHYYGVGAYLRPLSDARRSEVRFASECLGFANVPSAQTLREVFQSREAVIHHPRWKAGTPRDSGSGWDFEDVRDHYLKALFGIDPVPLRYANPDRYLALSRVVTGEVMAAVFSEWRRERSVCRGGLVWFYKDLYPGAGWGIVDSLGHPKAAYYYLKRVFTPLTLFFSDEGLNGLQCHLVNETAHARGVSLRIALYREGRVRVAEKTLSLALPSHGQQEITLAELFDGFLDMTYAYRFGPPGHDLVVATLFEQDQCLAQAFYFPQGLPSEQRADIGLEAAVARSPQGVWELTVKAQGFAQSVAIEIKGYSPEDNYFHLEAGQPRVIRLTSAIAFGLNVEGPERPPGGTVWALNAASPVNIRVTS